MEMDYTIDILQQKFSSFPACMLMTSQLYYACHMVYFLSMTYAFTSGNNLRAENRTFPLEGNVIPYEITPTHKPCDTAHCKDKEFEHQELRTQYHSEIHSKSPSADARDTTPLKESGACVIQGSVHLNHNWYGYLAELRLKKEGGKVYFKFTYPEEECCLKMLIYLTEQVDHLRAPMNCLQKQAILDPKSSQVITLSPSSNHSGCRTLIGSSGGRMLECKSGRLLKSQVERVWYIAASSCGSTKGLDFHYSLIVFGNLGKCPETSANNLASTLAYNTGYLPILQHSLTVGFSMSVVYYRCIILHFS